MSLCDFQWLFPDEDINAFVKKMFDQNIQLVAITSGEGGAWLYTPENTVFQSAAKINVLDTIGAGDTFTAGLLSVLVNHVENKRLKPLTQKVLEEAICTATIAAAINCTRKGANPPKLNEVETFVI